MTQKVRTATATTLSRRDRRNHGDKFTLARAAERDCRQYGARDVSTIAVGQPKNTCDDEDWGRNGNKRLHDWAFGTPLSHIEYKSEERGIEIERVDEY